MTAHQFSAKTIDGTERSLGEYKGQALLVVNVASQCGLTPQYAGLEKLHETYGPRGLAVLGFPCNQFGAQEPGTEGEIKTFCETQFGVKFPLFAKIDVNGPAAHPLYAWLRGQSGGRDIKWNFEKFLLDGEGKLLLRFAPTTRPDDEALVGTIEDLLTTS
jgi:glutathione peroxidase